jgi:hypothetical protein
MRRLFNEHLARVEWDEWKFPVRLFPVTSSDVIRSTRSIAIDAHVAKVIGHRPAMLPRIHRLSGGSNCGIRKLH